MRGWSARLGARIGTALLTGAVGGLGLLCPPAAFAAPSSPTPWSGTVPGAVCGSPSLLVLRHGVALAPTTRWPEDELHGGGGGEVQVFGYGPVRGNLAGGLPVQVVNVSCTNGGGTADGELSDSLVVFDVAKRPPAVVGILDPGVASGRGLLPPTFDDQPGGVSVQPGRLVAQQVFYGPQDATCCPSGKATTVWRVVRGHLVKGATTLQQPPATVPPS